MILKRWKWKYKVVDEYGGNWTEVVEVIPAPEKKGYHWKIQYMQGWMYFATKSQVRERFRNVQN